MKSSQQGAGFRMMHKQDIEVFPFLGPGRPAPSIDKRIVELARTLQKGGLPLWGHLGAAFAMLAT
jgi:hypothetical protein